MVCRLSTTTSSGGRRPLASPIWPLGRHLHLSTPDFHRSRDGPDIVDGVNRFYRVVESRGRRKYAVDKWRCRPSGQIGEASGRRPPEDVVVLNRQTIGRDDFG